MFGQQKYQYQLLDSVWVLQYMMVKHTQLGWIESWVGILQIMKIFQSNYQIFER